MAFTAVKTSMTAAFPGMRADLGKNQVRSCVSEEGSAEIRFGAAVKKGTADNGALIPTATADKILGIVQHSHAYNKDNELGDTGLKPKTVFDVAEYGKLMVLTEEAVTPASAVRLRVSGGTPGAFRATSAGAGLSVDYSASCRWTGTFASGFAELEFDFTKHTHGVAD